MLMIPAVEYAIEAIKVCLTHILLASGPVVLNASLS